MEWVGIPTEEGKLNTPVPEPHNFFSYLLPHTFLALLHAQVSNTASEISPVSDNYGSESKNDGAT